MNDYIYDGYILPFVSAVAAPMPSRIGAADTPGRPGGYAGRRYAAGRGVTVTGTLTAADYDTLQAAWSTLCARHDVETPRSLVVRDGWFLLALPETVADSERDISSIKYDITYRAADPYFYSSTLTTVPLAVGSTAFSVGGNAPALPTITLAVSAAPTGCSATISNSASGESCTIYPDAATSFAIDSRAERVTPPGSASDKTATFQGQFIRLVPGVSNSITISLSGGATLSSASLSYRSRSL